jgi:SOS-response transcriptional repressor LexA
LKIPDDQKQAISARVGAERTRLNLSLADLSKLAGCSRQTIFEIEKGGSFSSRVIHSVALALNLREEWLRTGKGDKSAVTSAVRESMESYTTGRGNVHVERDAVAWREVPVVSWATAGAAKNYEDLCDYLDERVVTKCKDKNAFAVIVDGDSMEPKVSAGDRIVISPNSEAQSGDLVIARTRKDHRVFFKKFLLHGPRGNKVRLVSFNPDYPPMEFELSDFRFIYPVVNLVRIYKHTNGGG